MLLRMSAEPPQNYKLPCLLKAGRVAKRALACAMDAFVELSPLRLKDAAVREGACEHLGMVAPQSSRTTLERTLRSNRAGSQWAMNTLSTRSNSITNEYPSRETSF